ncbi:MAG: hypothetical protein BM560_02520 [Roseobacter sp. MedPE-SWde]|nr:MAG: hypothetical protein BM560_02520 [Roseobacter sp. MedPE-SWde]
MDATIVQSLKFDLPIIALSVALAVLIVGVLAFFFSKPSERKSLFILIFGLATLGAVAGVAGGTSRVGVVGDVIPAALALAGGVAAYLFGVDQTKGLVASFCAAAFALALGTGYATGAGNRAVADNKDENLEFCRSLYSQSNFWKDDRSFCRMATIFGEQCNWIIADSLSKVPESATFKTTEEKFNFIHRQLNEDMKARLIHTQNCVEI